MLKGKLSSKQPLLPSHHVLTKGIFSLTCISTSAVKIKINDFNDSKTQNRNMEIKYFEFYCKFYYIDEHFELKMILWTKYLDNSRPCTKQMKKWYRKTMKKFVADVWKIVFSLTFNSMESYHPEQLQVNYKFLENLNLWRTYSTSGIGLFQEPPFYCKSFCSTDNSVRRYLLLKIVLHSLIADAFYGLRPNSAFAVPFWLICGSSICIKRPFFPFRTG